MKKGIKFAVVCAFVAVSTMGMTATASAATTESAVKAAQGGGFLCLLVTDEEWRYWFDCN